MSFRDGDLRQGDKISSLFVHRSLMADFAAQGHDVRFDLKMTMSRRLRILNAKLFECVERDMVRDAMLADRYSDAVAIFDASQPVDSDVFVIDWAFIRGYSRTEQRFHCGWPPWDKMAFSGAAWGPLLDVDDKIVVTVQTGYPRLIMMVVDAVELDQDR